MAKLHFRYGAMNAGKSTAIMQTAHNYEEQGYKVIIIKPSKDTKAGSSISARIGLERKVDSLIYPEDSIIDKLEKYLESINCILVDEAEFLKPEQVEELFYITKLYNIPVMAFGLRTDFTSHGFEGSPRLLELADSLEELPTICKCGHKARFNARKVNGVFVTEGESVLIDGSLDNVEYEPLCGECYVKDVLKLKRKVKKI